MLPGGGHSPRVVAVSRDVLDPLSGEAPRSARSGWLNHATEFTPASDAVADVLEHPTEWASGVEWCVLPGRLLSPPVYSRSPARRTSGNPQVRDPGSAARIPSEPDRGSGALRNGLEHVRRVAGRWRVLPARDRRTRARGDRRLISDYPLGRTPRGSHRPKGVIAESRQGRSGSRDGGSQSTHLGVRPKAR